MTDYREILRLHSLGINNTRIAESTAISRPTVITVLQRAAAKGLDWRRRESVSDKPSNGYETRNNRTAITKGT
jgi:transposase